MIHLIWFGVAFASFWGGWLICWLTNDKKNILDEQIRDGKLQIQNLKISIKALKAKARSVKDENTNYSIDDMCSEFEQL